MIDINIIRDTPQVLIADLEKRKDTEKVQWVTEIQTLDNKWKELKLRTDQLRQERNDISKEIAAKKKAQENADDLLEKAKTIPQKIQEIETEQEDIKEKIDSYLKRLPNITHESVPYGVDDTENHEISTFNEKPRFSFQPESHVDLIKKNNWVDLERAAKIAGARQYFLQGDLLLLELALQRYALDFLQAKGFLPVFPPHMMNRQSYEGVVDYSAFEEDIYKIEDEDLHLIATSEHPLTGMFMDEIFEQGTLPIKLAGISSCFRKEAGSHGKDQKGIFRVHQFNKIEQIIICDPEESWDFHEQLKAGTEEFWKSLGLHCRIVNICTGDLGTVAAKKYDIEVWMPVQNAYREVVSCSNCTDYQARRLKIRVRASGEKKNYHPHTLNSTAIATSRALVAILENNQTEDGQVTVPQVLQQYINNKEFLEPAKKF